MNPEEAPLVERFMASIGGTGEVWDVDIIPPFVEFSRDIHTAHIKVKDGEDEQS